MGIDDNGVIILDRVGEELLRGEEFTKIVEISCASSFISSMMLPGTSNIPEIENVVCVCDCS